MTYYPSLVHNAGSDPRHVGIAAHENCVGTAATFVCGCIVRFSINIDAEQKRIMSVRFKTNGCGYMIAAAETVSAEVEELFLADLHGLNSNDLYQVLVNRLGESPEDRVHCRTTCFDALDNAFSIYRTSQIEEFRAEGALVCTCFGISEDTVERVIIDDRIPWVERVGELCKAGTGCGSCRMLIQEMIDSRDD